MLVCLDLIVLVCCFDIVRWLLTCSISCGLLICLVSAW